LLNGNVKLKKEPFNGVSSDFSEKKSSETKLIKKKKKRKKKSSIWFSLSYIM